MKTSSDPHILYGDFSEYARKGIYWYYSYYDKWCVIIKAEPNPSNMITISFESYHSSPKELFYPLYDRNYFFCETDPNKSKVIL